MAERNSPLSWLIGGGNDGSNGSAARRPLPWETPEPATPVPTVQVPRSEEATVSVEMPRPVEPAPSAAPAATPRAPEPVRTPMVEESSTLSDVKTRIHRKLLERLNLAQLHTGDRDQIRAQIRKAVIELLNQESVPLNFEERESLIGELLDEIFGFGPLEILLKDPEVADILINTHKQIIVERHGKLELSNVRFKDDKHLMQVIDRIVSGVGRRVDESSPMVDARLPDGSRFNAIIPPLAIDGPHVSIRKFKRDALAGADLVRFEAITEAMLELLAGIVKARLNIIISGGTGAGKTTLLNILSSYIPHNERVVTIEDAAELQLRQPHVVRLETRPANIEGHGEISQRNLLINALRMRPDRVVMGECRGGEAIDMLQAMNTGHDGSMTTLHANTPRDALGRLETMISMANLGIPEKAMRQQIASAVDVIIQASRLSDGKRKVLYITEIVGMEGDVITMQDIFLFDRQGMTEDGRVLGRFRPTGIRPSFTDKLKAHGITLPPALFSDTGYRAAGVA